MPFLPFVLLLVWQVIGRSASFALGWATALYFGQVPGKQGHVLALISLVSPPAGSCCSPASACRCWSAPRPMRWASCPATSIWPAGSCWPLARRWCWRRRCSPRWRPGSTSRRIARWGAGCPGCRSRTRPPPRSDSACWRWWPSRPFLIVDRLRHKRVLAQMALTMKEGTAEDALPGGGCRRVARHGRGPPAGRGGPRLPGLAAAHGRLRGHPPARRRGPRRRRPTWPRMT